MRKLLAALVLLVAVAACGGPAHGTVEDRHAHPGYYNNWDSYDCVAYVSHTRVTTTRVNGQTRRSTSTSTDCVAHAWHHYHQWVPAWYELKLRDGKDVGWRTVSGSDYAGHPVGSHY